jgi:Flp pilus assembly protein TadB
VHSTTKHFQHWKKKKKQKRSRTEVESVTEEGERSRTETEQKKEEENILKVETLFKESKQKQQTAWKEAEGRSSKKIGGKNTGTREEK